MEVTPQTKVENLYIVPATISLAGAEIELVSTVSREVRLKRVRMKWRMTMILLLSIAHRLLAY